MTLISDKELYVAALDSSSITRETENHDGAALRSAGLDPIQTARAAHNIVTGYPAHIRKLQADGMSFEDALHTVLTTTWIEGAIVGCRAMRAKLEAEGE